MIFTLPANGLTNSADRRSKSWIKRLDKVDRTKKDGWAFEGEFRHFTGTEEAPNSHLAIQHAAPDLDGLGAVADVAPVPHGPRRRPEPDGNVVSGEPSRSSS